MSIGTDESDTALRAALLTSLAVAADSVPAAAPPWPQTRAQLVRISRRRRRRTATAVLGCAALVAAAGAVGAALLPGSPDRAAQVGTEQPEDLHAQIGFPLVGQEDWLTELRRLVVADPPPWTSVDFPGNPRTYQPVRLDQVQVQAAEELGGLRVIQVRVDQTVTETRTGITRVEGDSLRYGVPAGAAPTDVVPLRGDRESAAWPEPSSPGWVDVLSTRMVDAVELRVTDASGREQAVQLGDAMMARVHAPGARYVQLFDAEGVLQLTLPVKPVDLVAMTDTSTRS